MTRFCLYFSLIICLLALLSGPTDVAAQAGADNFSQGLKYEKAEQWEEAAGEFLEALKKDTAHTESIVHYKKVAAHIARPFIEQGRESLRKKDYAGAYQLFLKAYRYDGSIEWALSAVCNLQSGRVPDDGRDIFIVHEEERQREGIYCWSAGGISKTIWRDCFEKQAPVSEPLQAFFLSYINLEDAIRHLANDISLKVLFDAESFRNPRFVSLELKGVTSAQVIDYLFLQEGLVFVRLNENTIWVADEKRRAQVQPPANDEPKVPARD